MLETIWFVLWGLLWAVYFVLDGFDLGMGTLLPFVTRNEVERRTLYNSAGPFWDGNEVWLITAGGVTFAAFPKAYAVMFSALYAPLLMLLFALIMRAVSFEFRNKVDSPGWRKLWDVFQFLGNFVPALLFGVAFANLFMGIPIDKDGVYHGNLLLLLNPYGLAGGVFFVLMFSLHGALWLAIKSQGDLHARAVRTAKALWPYLVGVAVLFLAMTAAYTTLWSNYAKVPPLMIFPVLAVASLLTIRFLLSSDSVVLAWVFSALFIISVTFFGVLGMFPNLLPSSMDPAAHVSIYNGASSPLTLKIMLGVVAIFVPIVIAYQAWVYSVFSHKVTDEDLKMDNAY
ncbi:cytochrome d ubiquinol oxidase subunit II [Nitratidesulfovibrio vulgaris]|jgi:cytochrome d ubiquinol oxidase subunit II|uniref:Cytochrome d ubiquinol oxidase, subunit II n=1 Tax=Nitratidesulfovibrio vulgaris (strain ATCC 29579 / DSM 644 / CCUG 34227 / NCIMB 8303 / VKM B-1760 / Hildenborough) TaxID=882 RepID=Q726A3_NITV2|nr:cytochrome d ubiquinol oxidase subunit II [Nitratidesulfovibrio vulgaris]AAS97740.1 cytochrome d ubiquinol oxidase, subunit II [Nitratidesulfovibrio vulgaris str. Hildenborough]ADP88166.1 cytochrome d ubiquinol oxidase, subunit II [Nitratidesulfovibrio vulgaris RCH1]HBW15034.1 cytochrome d ubiquinol oxidase subunit II [Desulfovibrio sp.]